LQKFGKRSFASQKFACCYANDEKAPPTPLPYFCRHASILRRPCACDSTRAVFTRCCRLQCVTGKNINYQRYPKTEQLITAKISGNALKQGSSRTHSVLRQHSSQLQKFKVARMSRRIAVDQAGIADNGQPGLTV